MTSDAAAALIAAAAALVTAIAHALDLRERSRDRHLRRGGHRRTRRHDPPR